MNQNWRIAGAVFVQVAAPRTKSSLWSKSLRNLGECGTDLFACFVDLEKAYDQVPTDKLWKVLWKYGIDGQLLGTINSF